jgi:hypothetical protein
MKNILLVFFLIPILSYSQVINFKQKIDNNNYISYKDVKLDDVIFKGDSIFGINKDEGKLYVSFDKGIAFNNVETNKFCNDCNFHSNQDKIFGVNFFFLKGSQIILHKNSKFYISSDWLNFKPINLSTITDVPTEIKIIQKEDPNYFLLNCFFVNDTYFITFSESDGYNYRNYYSKDLISWKQIPNPNNLALASNEGIKYHNKSLYLFTWDTKNKSIAYYSNDLGKSWIELSGLQYKYLEGLGNSSFKNIMIFNNKIYYENLYKPFVYNIEQRTTTALSSKFPEIKNPKIKDGDLYFVSMNKIWTYKNDSISELKIDYSKFKYIEDAVITEKYIVINGDKSLITSDLPEIEKNKVIATDIESKYVIEKANTNFNSDGIDRKLNKFVYQNQHSVMEKPIPLKITSSGNVISYTPYFKKSSFESKRYIVSSKVNNTTTTKQLHLVNAKSINMFTNQHTTYKIKDYDVYNGDSPYYDEYNRDCDFNLKTVSTEVKTTSSGKLINFFKVYYNETENCIDKLLYPIFERFEFKINGNIETFRIKTYQGGNDVFGFIAETQYKNNVYLFSYDLIQSKLTVTNLSELNTNNFYRLYLNDFTIKKIYRTSDNNNYVFFQFKDKILPLVLGINSKPFFVENFFMNAGIVDEFKFNGWSGDIIPLYADRSREIISFANFYSDNNEIDKLNSSIKVYNKNFDLTFEKNIVGTKITNIYKYKNQLIIGGFSIDKGYVGFPNPRILVIDLTTKKITYDKVILHKNGKVENISSDNNGNIEITTAIWSKNWNHSKNLDLDSYIIFDKLDEKGVFINDLFSK